MMPTLPPSLRSALAHYAGLLRSALGPRVLDVRLFGSWARGEATRESDVDVWVLVDRLDDRTRRVPHALSVDVLLQREVAIAATVMDRQEWDRLVARERRLAGDIEREGVPL